MQIRSVEKSDISEWSRMRSALWPDSTDNHVAEIEEYFTGVSIDIVEAFVVERPNGNLGGFIEINLRNFAEGSRSSQVPYIEAWYVDQDLRGKGVGKRLMEKAEQWSLEKGFFELASDTELENIKSIAAHKALGFKEVDRVVCFLKKLV